MGKCYECPNCGSEIDLSNSSDTYFMCRYCRSPLYRKRNVLYIVDKAELMSVQNKYSREKFEHGRDKRRREDNAKRTMKYHTWIFIVILSHMIFMATILTAVAFRSLTAFIVIALMMFIMPPALAVMRPDEPEGVSVFRLSIRFFLIFSVLLYASAKLTTTYL